MQWKNLKLRKKLGIGFGVVLFLLALVGFWTESGVGEIIKILRTTNQLNLLSQEILQREVDHLNWAANVSDLLTNNETTKLSVQTDPKLCAFGKWYYGEGRKIAEQILPGLKEKLVQIEACHTTWHGVSDCD